MISRKTSSMPEMTSDSTGILKVLEMNQVRSLDVETPRVKTFRLGFRSSSPTAMADWIELPHPQRQYKPRYCYCRIIPCCTYTTFVSTCSTRSFPLISYRVSLPDIESEHLQISSNLRHFECRAITRGSPPSCSRISIRTPNLPRSPGSPIPHHQMSSKLTRLLSGNCSFWEPMYGRSISIKG